MVAEHIHIIIAVLLLSLLSSCGKSTKDNNHTDVPSDSVPTDTIINVLLPTLAIGKENGHEWIDLGMPSGTRWASCNLGANTSTDYGKRYAWGETFSKQNFSTENCEMYKIDSDSRPNNISGDATYDAARSEWGGKWQIPTTADFKELTDTIYTKWQWTTIDGVNGVMITGQNGNSIFFPASGYQDKVAPSPSLSSPFLHLLIPSGSNR